MLGDLPVTMGVRMSGARHYDVTIIIDPASPLAGRGAEWLEFLASPVLLVVRAAQPLGPYDLVAFIERALDSLSGGKIPQGEEGSTLSTPLVVGVAQAARMARAGTFVNHAPSP
jgi:hypothetical protein